MPMQRLRKFLSTPGLDVDCQKWDIQQMEVPRQGNDFDCGIYTCQWIKHLAFRVPPPAWSEMDCADFRILIGLELQERKLRWADAFGTKIS